MSGFRINWHGEPKPEPKPEVKHFCETCGVHTIKPVFRKRVFVRLRPHTAATVYTDTFCLQHKEEDTLQLVPFDGTSLHYRFDETVTRLEFLHEWTTPAQRYSHPSY